MLPRHGRFVLSSPVLAGVQKESRLRPRDREREMGWRVGNTGLWARVVGANGQGSDLVGHQMRGTMRLATMGIGLGFGEEWPLSADLSGPTALSAISHSAFTAAASSLPFGLLEGST